MCFTKPLHYAQSQEATLTVKLIIVVNTYLGVILQASYPKLVACT